MKKIKILQYTVLILTIVLLLVGSFAGYRAGYTLEDIWAAVSGSVLYSVLAVLGTACRSHMLLTKAKTYAIIRTYVRPIK